MFGLVILLDIAVGLLKQFLILGELVLEECFAEGLPDFAFTGADVLPAVEADEANNFVDVVESSCEFLYVGKTYGWCWAAAYD